MERTDLPEQTAHKAYAAALVAVLLYALNGVVTGEWTSLDALAPALTILVAPLAVWLIPNQRADR